MKEFLAKVLLKPCKMSCKFLAAKMNLKKAFCYVQIFSRDFEQHDAIAQYNI